MVVFKSNNDVFLCNFSIYGDSLHVEPKYIVDFIFLLDHMRFALLPQIGVNNNSCWCFYLCLCDRNKMQGNKNKTRFLRLCRLSSKPQGETKRQE